MNLIEAIKSGRPFRRKSRHVGWMSQEEAERTGFRLIPQDVLADDWEVQEPTVTITRKEFWAAVEKVFGIRRTTFGGAPALEYDQDPRRGVRPTLELVEIARKLGLED